MAAGPHAQAEGTEDDAPTRRRERLPMTDRYPEQSAARPPRRLYYGWVIVASMFVATMAQTAHYNPALSVFLKPITEEFGWTRSEFVGAITVGSLVGGLVAVLVGPVLDRRGPRLVMFVSFLVFGAAVAGIAAIQNIWQYYGLVITTRALVSGVLGIVAGVVVSKWFVRRRGRAMAISVTGTRVGQAIMPAYVGFFVVMLGWRGAAVALGGLVWLLTLVPMALFLRRQPEDMGLRPDGDASHASTTEAMDHDRADGRPTEEVSVTLRDALRTPAFYLILFATSGLIFNIGGINFNLYPYLTDRGIPETSGIFVLTAWSIVGAAGSVAIGFVAERFHVRVVMVATFIVASLAVVVLMSATTLPVALVFAVVHGLSFGGLPMLAQLVWADYFGRRHQGTIRGFVTPVQVVLQAVGPLSGTLIYDTIGNYTPAFGLYVGVYLASAVAMLLARPASKAALTAAGVPAGAGPVRR